MTDFQTQTLLPAGLQDTLPPDAEREAAIVETLLGVFASFGYDRVKPPLIEFEESLLLGAGATTTAETFRLMDPISQRMMGVRTDITVQVSRIAASRMARVPRPLRLCYAGQVLRVRGSQLRPERQFTQAGVELIGSFAPEADVEVIVMAAEAIAATGVRGLTIDLGIPPLTPTLCRALALPPDDERRLLAALDRKDMAEVAAVGGEAAQVFAQLLAAAGPVADAFAAFETLELSDEAAQHLAQLQQIAQLVQAAAPDLTLTIDALENRGFEYHNGVTFSLFAAGVRGELGRGGRYGVGEHNEPATGLTLYLDTLVRSASCPPSTRRLWVPYGTPMDQARRLRQQGWSVVAELAPEQGKMAERARHARCSHVWDGDQIVILDEGDSKP